MHINIFIPFLPKFQTGSESAPILFNELRMETAEAWSLLLTVSSTAIQNKQSHTSFLPQPSWCIQGHFYFTFIYQYSYQ